jgi:exonuclease III
MNINYKDKYLKYKQKYLNLRKLNIQTGGFNLKCPEDMVMCEKPTENMGMCVQVGLDCNTQYNQDKVKIPEIIWEETDQEVQSKYDLGIKKGYVDEHLHLDCNIGKSLVKYDNPNGADMPNEFSIITLNVMGIYRNKPDVLLLMEHRVNLLSDYILLNTPDLLCFQEMSWEFFNFLYKKISHIYPYYHEEKFTPGVLTARKKDIETFLISKYQPESINVIDLGGNLGYGNSILEITFSNLKIFNCYFQAGSRSSPGQLPKWLHYSRCRSQQFKFLKEKMDRMDQSIPVIILGDFNFHLDGDESEWPELKYLNDLRMSDSWKEINKSQDGFTENTDINDMRFNSKFEVKRYRYDAIFYKKLNPIESLIIGDKPVELLEPELNRAYERAILPKDGLTNPQLKIVRKDANDEPIYNLFISDHFGIYTKFTIN